jgi:prepilin-type N-terminal cleavage/methylation domain-containing protein
LQLETLIVRISTNIEGRLGERGMRAFTLLELLTVIAIIGILASIILPTIHGFRPNPGAVAASQLLGDVGRARQLAISQRTTVYMVFLPTNFFADPNFGSAVWTPAETERAKRLFDKQVIGYTFIALRSLGNQPGRPVPHYLSPWRSLPDGTFIPLEKFLPRTQSFTISTGSPPVISMRIYGFQRTNNIPFPSEETAQVSVNNPYINLPYIAFDYRGQLTSGQDEFLPISQGSVIIPRDPVTGLGKQALPTVVETPPGNTTNSSFNVVSIDWLTGRAHIERQEIR